MHTSDRRQSASQSARFGFLTTIVVSILGCGAEQFNGGGAQANPGATASGGSGSDTDGGAVATGWGGAGGGDDGTGGDNRGTGGQGTGAGGGSTLDSAVDLPPSSDSGGGDAAMDSAADLSRPVDAADAGDAASDARACPGETRDLSNVGTGDFRISFHIVTTQMGWAALLNQRSSCSLGLFWDIRQTAAGTILAETDGNTSASYQTAESTTKINDGKPHDILVARVAGSLIIRIDGPASGQGPSSAALGALPALKVGNDPCGSASNPATAPFAGTTLSGICISRG
jgi:hypothetical protein